MEKHGLSQEGLKLFACVVMLIDHVGAVLFPQHFWMREVGRLAFPIFCFLLAEGVHYTRSPGRYVLRLTIGAAISELPFDYGLFGRMTLGYQNVMLTMLLGFLALLALKKLNNPVLKVLAVAVCCGLAKLLKTDYAWGGVLLILLFGVTRELPRRLLWQTIGMGILCGWVMPGAMIQVWGIRFGVELLAVFALIPIALYSGKKLGHSKAAQWGFYLFYPVHLSILWILRGMPV